MGSGGFIEMVPAEVEVMGHRLGVHAQELADGWSTHESTITGADSAIGGDVLGSAFRGVYTPESATVRENARMVPAMMQRDSDAAIASAAFYTDADQRSAAEFSGIRPPGPSSFGPR